jgi:hypothetical protein
MPGTLRLLRRFLRRSTALGLALGQTRWGHARGRRARLSLGGTAVCIAGCISGCISGSDAKDHALYPESAGKLEPSQVARLVGYVRTVDGKDVSGMDGGFLLQPGCHLVVTPSEWGKGDPNSGAVTAHTGPVPFVLPMQASHQYLIEVRTGVMTGPTGSLTLKAYERDAEGKELAEFEPAQGDGDLEKCRDQLGGQGAAPP